jgi:hypothetical protein
MPIFFFSAAAITGFQRNQRGVLRRADRTREEACGSTNRATGIRREPAKFNAAMVDLNGRLAA